MSTIYSAFNFADTFVKHVFYCIVEPNRQTS